ncbi:hypothetical protein HOP62_02635 [Halomonas sp. MCCC 1A17488]|uniref:hypothetical protein n=1 Tax=unclassified Halomonas TaxID=2609666 RepID=UPI0018D21894|nr:MULTISPECIES: hypothetical protein [unclassified Halomonas]MCE8014970.1 hypothetical protein [Halomonas sp. MCCC 1A17488]MCG3238303.1 hypothetical protein [Halomonas sp. MCCC 1A17488]QPP47944.1 hypothetical protein I4484_11765 [Halomonas sp. SS10-MC5]
MTSIRSQVFTVIQEIHPFYQRHKRWLYPIKDFALHIPALKRLRDAAIDGKSHRESGWQITGSVERALQNQHVAGAVPSLIAKTPIKVMPVVFEDVVLFYREAVRYDDLKIAINFFCEWLEDNFQKLPGRQLVEYVETFEFALRSLNGRTVTKVPKIQLGHLQNAKVVRRAYLVYFTVLVDNLEFKRAEQLLRTVTVEDHNLLFQAAIVLQRKPARVELDATSRLTLRDTVLVMLEENLLELGVPDSFTRMIDASVKANELESFLTAVQNVRQTLRKNNQTEEWVARLAPIFKHVLRQLISLGHIELARIILQQCKATLSESIVDDIETRLAVNELSEAAAYTYLRNNAQHSQTARNLLLAAAWDRNDFQTARILAEQPLSTNAPLRRQISRKSTVDRLHFLEQTSEIVHRIEQPEQPTGYVLLASLNCFNTLAMVTPALIELKRQGFAVGSLMKGVLNQQPPSAAHASIADLFNSIDRAREDGELVLDWKVDWSNRVVSAEGINFYQGVYERLSTIYRRATIAIDDEPVASAFASILRRCDYILRHCKNIERAAEQSEQPIVLLGSNSHVAPYSVFRDFALARPLPNLRYVAASVAYENYYTNLGSKTSGSMAVVDMTLHRNCRAPFLAIPERFERWYQDNKGSQEVHKRFEELVAKNRTGRDEGVHSSPAAAALNHARREGRRIVCCFGKILCDLAVPYDGGPAHEDMIDWLHHSVEIARANPDLLLLIKPHPHELRPEIALELTEKLEDVLPENLPKNVVVLNHAEFNAGDLAQYLDLAVLWNGTACLELTGLGVPVVMCSHFGRYDYPLALNYPKDRTGYENLLAKAILRAPAPELRKKAMGLLHYMGTKEVALPNTYSRRPITNDSIGVPTWYMDKINDYLISGDSYMELAACRIIEGVKEGVK